jgi:hypothetical protein
MPMQSLDPIFATRSLYAAAFLLALDFPLVDTTKDHEGRVIFQIGGGLEERSRRIREYRSGAAMVNAQRFGSELRRLKAMLHGTD